MIEKRIKKIFSNTKNNIDLIIIKNSIEPFIDKNFFYVTGLIKGLFESSIAAIYPDGKISILVSGLEEESAKKSNANIMVYSNLEEYNNFLSEMIGNGKKIGLNFSNLTYNDYCKFSSMFSDKKFFDISEGLIKSRRIKDNYELNYIKKSCEIVDRVVEKIPDFISHDLSENDLAAEINYYMQKYGGEKPAFDTISSFGKNSAEPHYTHSDIMIKSEDFILCDFGTCFNKYNSDITRTFIFEESTDKQKKMYDTVLKAQRIGLETIKPGVLASEVHKNVFNFIQNSEFKDFFIHSTGHSLGLDVHDPGVGFRSESEVILEENMVLTVEPGVYIPGFGGVRIEDDIVVTKNGYSLLTKSSKDLIVV